MDKKILIAIVAAVLVIGGGGAYALLSGDKEADQVKDAKHGGAKATEPQHAEPIYLPLDPPFVINFVHNGTLRYLQLAVSVMARDQAVLDRVKAHMPAIRNNLILLLSGQTYEQLGTREGKEQIRTQILGEISTILGAGAASGSPKSTVEAVYLTAFVMQ